MKLTPEQILKIKRMASPNTYNSFNKPISSKERWLYDGEIVRFSMPSSSFVVGSNFSMTVNDDSGREIWYSQLANWGVMLEPELGFYKAAIYLKNGDVCDIRDVGAEGFRKIVEGRSFRVETLYQLPLTINQKSKMMNAFVYYSDCFQFIRNCITNDRLDKIGDLFKTSSIYDLYEV